jgi:hypothetical protein
MPAIIIAIIAAIIGVGSFYYSKKSDGPVEQIAERVIEQELGLPKDSVDLSPDK